MSLFALVGLNLKSLQRVGPPVLVGALSLLVFAVLATWQPAWMAPAPAGGEAGLALSSGAWSVSGSASDVLLADPLAPQRRLDAMTRRLMLGATVLATVWAMLGLMALVLAITQRSRTDLILTISALAWSLHTVLSSRFIPGGVAGPTPSVAVVHGVLLLAVAALVSYVVRIVGWKLQDPPHRPVWPAWAVGIVMATMIGWSRGGDGDASPGVWFTPLACMIAAFIVLTRHLGRPADVATPPRSIGFWWVVGASAVAIGCGAYDLWLRGVQPELLGTRMTLWFLTRWAVVALMSGMVAWRLQQLAHTTDQLGRSHRQWRRRVRNAQSEVEDLQRGLGLRDLVSQHRQERDRVARETLDDALRSLQRLETRVGGEGLHGPALDDLHGNLQDVRDSLEGAPMVLEEALSKLYPRLERQVTAAGGHLSWMLDSRTETVVLPAGETLLCQRILSEAVEAAEGLDWLHAAVAVRIEVIDGETGQHLRMALVPHADGANQGRTAPAQDLFGHRVPPAVAASRARLQRLATELGAQMVLEARPGEPGGIEIVKPLRGR